MKKITNLIFIIIFLTACNAGGKKEDNNLPDLSAESHAEQAVPATPLVLNGGAKWKADAATLENVALLQKATQGAKPGSLEDYLQTSQSLTAALDKMVSDCKMKGEDHEALHHWLEPLMEKTTALKRATSIQTAASIFGEIENQLALFPQYFE